MPRKSKKYFTSYSTASHTRKINDKPVIHTKIDMNLSPRGLDVTSCKNGNIKSQKFKNPAQFIHRLQNHNMSIHDTLAHIGKNKISNPHFIDKRKPHLHGFPHIIRIKPKLKETLKLKPKQILKPKLKQISKLKETLKPKLKQILKLKPKLKQILKLKPKLKETLKPKLKQILKLKPKFSKKRHLKPKIKRDDTEKIIKRMTKSLKELKQRI